jgi:hypothetical protein
MQQNRKEDFTPGFCRWTICGNPSQTWQLFMKLKLQKALTGREAALLRNWNESLSDLWWCYRTTKESNTVHSWDHQSSSSSRCKSVLKPSLQTSSAGDFLLTPCQRTCKKQERDDRERAAHQEPVEKFANDQSLNCTKLKSCQICGHFEAKKVVRLQ